MRKATNFKVSEWMILFGMTITAVAISKFTGLSYKWRDAFVYSVILLIALLLSLRQLWSRRFFWRNFLGICVLHLFVLFALVRSLPPEWHGIPELVMIVGGVIEGLLLL